MVISHWSGSTHQASGSTPHLLIQINTAMKPFGSTRNPTRVSLDLRAHSNHITIIISRLEFQNSINHASLNRATDHDISSDLSFTTYLHMIFLSDQSR